MTYVQQESKEKPTISSENEIEKWYLRQSQFPNLIFLSHILCHDAGTTGLDGICGRVEFEFPNKS